MLDEAAHMEPRGVLAAMQELVDRAGVPVECEHDVGVMGEQFRKPVIRECVRMILARKQRHQVDDVHDPDPQVRGVLA